MNQEFENRRVEESPDWKSLGITNDEEEVIDYLMENFVCNYCRHQVSPDIGQVEIFCPHCEMITTAVKQ